MKKTLLIFAAALTVSAAAFSQTKSKVLKPAFSTFNPDSTKLVLSDKDVLVRLSVIQALSYSLTNAGDVTPNQGRKIKSMADSIIAVDGAWYNKLHPQKQK